MPEPVIHFDSLTRRYGPRRGVESLTLRVPEACVYGFLGPNGAGKTTAIRVLMGMLRPTSGAASVRGLDCWSASHLIKRSVGYVPGDLRLYPWLNARRGLELAGAVRGMDLAAGGLALCDRLDLDPEVAVRRMSRGTRQKLGLVLALAPRPALLVLDEPTGGLDPLVQLRLRDLLREAAGEGRTVFFSSHTLGEVEQLCDRVAIIRDGRLVADDTLEALRRSGGHVVSIRWSDEGPPTDAAPPGLRVTARDGRVWTCTHDGPLTPLLAWLAERQTEDVSITRPDLETLFRRYYHLDGTPL